MRESRRRRLDVGFPQEKREPGSEEEQRDADGDVVDPREIADRGVEQPEPGADPTGDEHAEPRRAGEIGDGVSAHGAHHERAFEPEIDATTLLGERLTEAHVEVWRRDADRASDDRDQRAPPPEIWSH